MMDQQQQRDHLDEAATRAELDAEGRAELDAEELADAAERIVTGLAVAATIGRFVMDPRAGEFLAGVIDGIRETGGRVPFARPPAEPAEYDPDDDYVLPYVDPAELPDWTRDCPFSTIREITLTDGVPF